MGVFQERKGIFLSKVCEIRYATIQGMKNLEYHFKDTNVYTKREKEQQPFLLNSN